MLKELTFLIGAGMMGGGLFWDHRMGSVAFMLGFIGVGHSIFSKSFTRKPKIIYRLLQIKNRALRVRFFFGAKRWIAVSILGTLFLSKWYLLGYVGFGLAAFVNRE